MSKEYDMYIVEALHEIPVLADRIEKCKKQIREYSSGVSNMVPQFKTEQAQRKQVASLLQSALDLTNRLLHLKRCIAFTNAVSIVEIDGFKYSVTELIALRQNGGRNGRAVKDTVNEVYDSQCDHQGRVLMSQFGSQQKNDSEAPKVVLYYDEAERNAKREAWYNFASKITSTLEVFNARTKLIDPDDFKCPAAEQIKEG